MVPEKRSGGRSSKFERNESESDRLAPLIALVSELSRRAVGPQECEDVAQDTWVRLVRHLARREVPEVMRLAHLALRWSVLNHVRRESRWRQHQAPAPDHLRRPW